MRSAPRRVRPGRRRARIALGIAAAAVCLLALYHGGTPTAADQWVAHLIRYRQTLALTRVALAATFVGSAGAIATIGVLVTARLCACGRWRLATVGAGASVGSWLVNLCLKAAFARSRPTDLPQLTHAAGFGFPSGHTMVSASFYGFLVVVAARSTMATAGKAAVALTGIGVVAAVGISRIYLGIHYTTDVLAGLVAGCCWLGVCFALVPDA